MQQTSYDFPVSLQPVFTRAGSEVPRVKAVVREDLDKPIATVSNRYHLMPHKEVVDQASKFVSLFGRPEENFHLGTNGAVLVGQYTYKEVTKEVKTNDVVGLRVYVENSYNGTKSIGYRVGALRLKCLNGMVGSQDVFSMRFRHTKEAQEIKFPKKEEIQMAFSVAVDGWSEFAKLDLDQREYVNFAEKLVENHLLPNSFVEKNHHLTEMEESSVWGLYNAATAFVTHKSKAQEVGKVNRLGRIDSWFSDMFIHRNTEETH